MLIAIIRHIVKRKALGILASHTLISLIIMVYIPVPARTLSVCGPHATSFKITAALHDAARICHYLLHKKKGGSRETDTHISATVHPFIRAMDHSFLRAAQVSGSKGKAARPTPFLGTAIVL